MQVLRETDPFTSDAKNLKKKIGTKESPMQLQTPPGTTVYTMRIEEKEGLGLLICSMGKTMPYYDARCIEDLHAMLKRHCDWMALGGTDEQKLAKEGAVEA